MRTIIRVIFATVLLISGTVFLSAQTEEAPDFQAWAIVAERATNAIEAGRASDVALTNLREQLVGWRDQFLNAQNENANAIQILNNQLETLGDAPEDGIEPEETTAQRESLLERQAELAAPVKTAEIAYTEADGLIGGIDAILRERQTEELLALGPTPVNPINWGKGLVALQTTFGRIGTEVISAWQSTDQRAEFKRNLPKVLLLLAMALLLLARGRLWVERLTAAIQTETLSLARWLVSTFVSLGQIALPLVGLYALTEAIYSTELAGLRGEIVLSVLPLCGLYILGSVWLGGRVFPKSEVVMPLIRLTPRERAEGRFYSAILGFILAADVLLAELLRYEGWSSEAKAVIFFPLFVVAALIFWRLGMLMRNHEDKAEETGYGDRLLAVLGLTLMGIAIAAVILAAIGYFNAADRLVIPTAMTLQLLGLILVIQRVVTAIYGVVTGTGEQAKESLLPVLLGFVLMLGAIPFLSLIWGARWSDLTEIWTQASLGLAIGETRISPTDFLTFVLVFVFGYLATRLLQGTMKNTILPKTRLDLGGRNAIVSGIGYLGIFLSAVIAITSAGIDLSSIALVAGALSVGIGFGLQNVVSNFVSGIILLIERPISEGDWIEVGGNMGYVRDISVRSTRIETFDRTDVIVPNADLVSGTVTNYTRGNTVGRVIVPVGVAYGTDPRWIEGILLEIAKSHPMVLENPAPKVVFQGFGASSLDFEIRAILRDVNWSLTVRSDLNFEIAKRFMEENIEIPFAQTDIWLRNPETLRTDGKPNEKKPSKDDDA